jgi:hypothetical protein
MKYLKTYESLFDKLEDLPSNNKSILWMPANKVTTGVNLYISLGDTVCVSLKNLGLQLSTNQGIYSSRVQEVTGEVVYIDGNVITVQCDCILEGEPLVLKNVTPLDIWQVYKNDADWYRDEDVDEVLVISRNRSKKTRKKSRPQSDENDI